MIILSIKSITLNIYYLKEDSNDSMIIFEFETLYSIKINKNISKILKYFNKLHSVLTLNI